MRKSSILIACGCALLALSVRAQFGRGGGEWSTSGGDAQRSSWVRTDPKISTASMQKPGFAIVWKVKLGSEGRQPNTFSGTTALLNGYIGYRGFRSLGFIAGGGGTVSALDTDLGRIEWQKQLGAAAAQGSAGCPGGMTANVTKPVGTAFPPTPQGGGRGFGRGAAAKSGVGEADQGAVTIQEIEAAQARMAAAMAARGGGRGPGRGPGGFRRMPNYLHAVSADGMFHLMQVSNGDEPEKPIRFLPANANVRGLIVANNAAYAATTNGCGGAPNAVWALDIESKQVSQWKPASGDIAGSDGPAIAPDGTVYVATTAGDLVALEPRTLKVKSSYAAKQEFTSSPLLFEHKGRTLVAAATKDGRIHLLDAADLSKPLATPQAAAAGSTFTPGALASWQDPAGTRWMLAPDTASVAAWKLTEKGGAPSLETGWTSRDIAAPSTPIIVNGVVFALSSGSRSTPAVLYALDGETGKEYWNSGKSISSYVQGGGVLSAGGTQVYLATHDGAFYAFGFPMEH